ncbi:MAG: hypothetical protein ACLGG7_10345 [Bacteriovoracia bacterium]
MNLLALAWLLFIVGCAAPGPAIDQAVTRNNAKTYAYRDVSGTFELSREVRLEKAKLATRVQIYNSTSSGEKLLEKTFAISAIGSVQTRAGRSLAIRPEHSQHTVWLEGKKYFSQLKLNPRTKKLEALLESPESRWNGRKDIAVPKGRVFCFYSQLPECLVAGNMLALAKSSKGPLRFFVVWDSWPYHQEHFTGLGPAAFVRASLSLEGRQQGHTRYIVEINGQLLNLHFSKEGSFIRMFWTTQGISIMPPGEVEDNQEI